MPDKASRIVEIDGQDIVETVRAALQYVAVYHAPDYLAHLVEAYHREQSAPARMAIGQILESSRLAAVGRRPICQDTGVVNVFAKIGQSVVINSDKSLSELINQATRLAYLDAGNPLRASVVSDPIFQRRNTLDNTPAVTHSETVVGNTLELLVAAKGFGAENKSRLAILNPGDSVEDWVVDTIWGLGAGWCPPGVIGIGVGGTVEKALMMAKTASISEVDITDLIARGPQTHEEELRLRLYDRINALGIGAQGLGGMTTVVDVKIATYPTQGNRVNKLLTFVRFSESRVWNGAFFGDFACPTPGRTTQTLIFWPILRLWKIRVKRRRFFIRSTKSCFWFCVP